MALLGPDDVRGKTFPTTRRAGYAIAEVDRFIAAVADRLATWQIRVDTAERGIAVGSGPDVPPLLTADAVMNREFPLSTPLQKAYDVAEVDDFLDALAMSLEVYQQRLAAAQAGRRPAGS